MTEDISAAIERFEKLLGTDLKYTDSFKKMKEKLGSSGGSGWEINDRDQTKPNISADIAEKVEDKEETKDELPSSSQMTTKPSENESEDEKVLYQCLSSTNFSFTQYFDKIDTKEETEKKRKLVVEKIKAM